MRSSISRGKTAINTPPDFERSYAIADGNHTAAPIASLTTTYEYTAYERTRESVTMGASDTGLLSSRSRGAFREAF